MEVCVVEVVEAVAEGGGAGRREGPPAPAGTLGTAEPTRKAEGSRDTRVVVRGNVHVLVLKLADPRPYRVLRLRVGEHRAGLEWRFDVRQASRRSGFPRLGLLDVRRRVRVHIL